MNVRRNTRRAPSRELAKPAVLRLAFHPADLRRERSWATSEWCASLSNCDDTPSVIDRERL